MKEKNKGFCFCFSAYIIWGLLPIYWKTLNEFTSLTILAHRIVWSLVFTIILLLLTFRLKELKLAFQSTKDFFLLILRTLFVVSNWLIYVWSINNNRILDCSLGYFICPLTAVLLGYIFLNEKLTKKQILSLILVLAAVLNLIFNFGHFPWISISIAFTFAFYGLLKKTSSMESLPSLCSETLLLSIPTLFFLIISGNNTNWNEYNNISFIQIVLLILSGPATAIPLILYTFGVRKIKISTAGILQYFTPTSTFFIGLFIYNEPFKLSQLISYCIIWFSIALYLLDIFKIPKKLFKIFLRSSNFLYNAV